MVCTMLPPVAWKECWAEYWLIELQKAWIGALAAAIKLKYFLKRHENHTINHDGVENIMGKGEND